MQVQHNGPARKMRNCADTSWHSVTILVRPAPLRRSQFKFGIFVSHSVGIRAFVWRQVLEKEKVVVC